MVVEERITLAKVGSHSGMVLIKATLLIPTKLMNFSLGTVPSRIQGYLVRILVGVCREEGGLN